MIKGRLTWRGGTGGGGLRAIRRVGRVGSGSNHRGGTGEESEKRGEGERIESKGIHK